jgi:hypothetical protein
MSMYSAGDTVDVTSINLRRERRDRGCMSRERRLHIHEGALCTHENMKARTKTSDTEFTLLLVDM